MKVVKRILKIAGYILGGFALLVIAAVVVAVVSPHGRITLPVLNKGERFEAADLSAYPPALHVDGNRLVNPQGQPVTLRGVMIKDPYRLSNTNRFNRNLFEDIRATGANVVRIPVHPDFWLRDPDYLWRYLDKAVRWCGELGMYAIIDWHSIGNVQTGTSPHSQELYNHTMENTRAFWDLSGGYFASAQHVLFELFNEPQGITTAGWHASASELTRMLREKGAQQVIIVGGIDFARTLSWVPDMPVDDSNVAYAAHIYPSHSRLMWDEYFGRAAEDYVVLITEWGFVDASDIKSPPYLRGSERSYGAPLLAYMSEREIGWTACWYDDEWYPPMFQPGWDEMNGYGRFVLDALGAKLD